MSQRREKNEIIKVVEEIMEECFYNIEVGGLNKPIKNR